MQSLFSCSHRFLVPGMLVRRSISVSRSLCDIDFSKENPMPFQLEHIRNRLIETTPDFFRMRLDYTFYRNDVVLEDQLTGRRVQGIDKLRSHFGLLAVVMKFCYPHIDMEVVDCHPQLEDSTVRLRWRVKYVSFWRLFTNPRLFRFEYRLKNLSWYDGYSIFYADGNGDVYKMTMQRMRRDDAPALNDKAEELKKKIKNVVSPSPVACSQTRKERD